MERMAVTGGAGFIGSNLAEFLIGRGHSVVLVDNFSSGKPGNMRPWADNANDRLTVVKADINETDRMRSAFKGARYVFHLAAIPSVSSSISDPLTTNRANIDGTLSVLLAARDAGVLRVVVASSCAVYGDDPELPKTESMRDRSLSPYALSKRVSEEYCRLFYELYGLETCCLRYFNVFGPRQDPKSEYAAVVPRFITRILAGKAPLIYGDGEQTRDFVYVGNVVEANWVAATHPRAAGEVFNIGCGAQTSLNELVHTLNRIHATTFSPIYEAARPGEVRYSVASVEKARRLLDFSPSIAVEAGLERVSNWYRENLRDLGSCD